MTRTVLWSAVALILSAAPAEMVWAGFSGFVERPWTPTICAQESHFLTDPCTGMTIFLDDFGAIDLDPYLCKHVVVDGPDVGVTCQVISSQSVAPSQPVCPITFTDLWLTGDDPTQINWLRVTCAVSHDVIRGEVGSLRPDPPRIDLGAVTCLANDLPQADFWYISGPTDGIVPPVGQAYFYLVRAAGVPFGDTTYGHSSDGLERVPGAEDCPL